MGRNAFAPLGPLAVDGDHAGPHGIGCAGDFGETLSSERLADAPWGAHPPATSYPGASCASLVLGAEAIESTFCGYRLASPARPDARAQPSSGHRIDLPSGSASCPNRAWPTCWCGRCRGSRARCPCSRTFCAGPRRRRPAIGWKRADSRDNGIGCRRGAGLSGRSYRMDQRATIQDVHEIAAAMPFVTVEHGSGENPVYQVGGKSFIFFRTPRPDAVDPVTAERYADVIVFWVPSDEDKLAMVQDDGNPFFTTPHFNGHRSVLLRASRIGELSRTELAEVIQDAWLSRASPRRAAAWLKEVGQDSDPVERRRTGAS